MSPFRLIALGLALLLASSSQALSQQKPQPQVFPSGTGLVVVDFVVTDKSDRLVGGLKAEDFVVKEDGKERPVLSFASFAKGQALGATPAEGTAEDVAKAPPIQPGGVSTVLFVDDGQLKPLEAARLVPALKRVVEIVGEQKGILALVAPLSNIQMADEAAGSRPLFWAAIDKIVGHRFDDRSLFPVSDVEAILAEQGDLSIYDRLAKRFFDLNRGLIKYDMAMVTARSRVMEVAAAARIRRGYAHEVLLKSLAWLAGKPGRHSVVMVSDGYASDEMDLKQREVVNRSLQANAPIHFLDARGLQGVSQYLDVQYRGVVEYDALEPPLSFSDAAAGASGLADDTGGLYIRNTNDMVKGVTRILDMTSTYYVLGYEPPVHKERGFRKIKVEVATKGLKVRSRRGYFDDAAAAR